MSKRGGKSDGKERANTAKNRGRFSFRRVPSCGCVELVSSRSHLPATGRVGWWKPSTPAVVPVHSSAPSYLWLSTGANVDMATLGDRLCGGGHQRIFEDACDWKALSPLIGVPSKWWRRRRSQNTTSVGMGVCVFVWVCTEANVKLIGLALVCNCYNKWDIIKGIGCI